MASAVGTTSNRSCRFHGRHSARWALQAKHHDQHEWAFVVRTSTIQKSSVGFLIPLDMQMSKLTFSEEMQIFDILDLINETDADIINSILIESARNDSTKKFYMDIGNFLFPIKQSNGEILWLKSNQF